ncbi:TPA: 3-oxoacyl-[acyl-carrier-protein] synthase III C-terminal domain-containing protein [Burkholderia cenocepacia]|uniref:3-oxoacyl-[acyl-carrier-protein] synthase III C-terminal domain-containing protein n=1 Tax=Burkholderia cenocepacia TaxID=95486 RepID=UPI00222ED276|nr:3-oxoacyl-[acyl-carrier-protein] synthase III C-terminal domain-containing protein [Burkholderia cenocepacia]MDN7695870.1 3-oxoacyl-[acyl-carrier-protein] synthase III C-terminal domain-containing protein [Burkholderia cenocepacia]MDS0801888.1 3-oxoacyl-ACP synthase [Burkholderia cenocepacia]
MQAVYGDTLRWRDECEPQRAPKAPSPPTLSDELAVAESNLSLSDMALCAARLLYDGASQLPRPDQIIVCSTSFEHDLALSCAGRLHHELASRRPPFAIGQLQDVSFATALDLTLAMMDADIELNTVLIVAAERWLPPFSRYVDLHTLLADGAAAALVTRHPTPGWRVRGLTICTPATPSSSSVIATPVNSATLMSAINKALARAACQATQMDWIVPAKTDNRLLRSIRTHGDLPLERIWLADDTPGYLCAAHTPARLDSLTRAVSPRDGQHLLVWSTGFHSQVACAILQFCEAPS